MNTILIEVKKKKDAVNVAHAVNVANIKSECSTTEMSVELQ